MIRSGTASTLKSGSDAYVFRQYGSSCEEVRLIEPYVCRRLTARASARFERHLFSCERCLHAVEFELLVKRAVADFAKFTQFSRSWH